MGSKQGGVGDPNDGDSAEAKKLRDIANLIIILFGDLGVGERFESLQGSRSEETTHWRRLQNVIYVLGLFHVKMACADAVWRTFIEPLKARNESDEHSLMADVKVLRPKETGKIASKPGFRRMHEVIQHSGIVARLDCWRVEASKNTPEVQTLQQYAQSKPSWEDLKACAAVMATTYVARPDLDQIRRKPESERDEVNENMLLRHHMFLLYEELSYAMNEGDIGRIETCFLPWSYIFQATRKHKYATALKKYLRDVHFRYPPRLRRHAIRMHILVNPTGKAGKFRGVDWWVEHNNLYLKRIYGGKFANHTKAHILKESPLIGVFKNARIQVQKMFRMTKLTSHHSGPKMQQTFNALGVKYQEHMKSEFIGGRKTYFPIVNKLTAGMHLAQTATWKKNDEDNDDGEWEDLDIIDNEEEVEEQGDLEIDD
ncbi:hypothetical protein BT96DRAFT_811716 [Gymnopus androsaceus JB14]|uniref:DUF6589 domain-containing protein n=1 Tax=Gymnopus androsaceus JB14 TaxID=1447944 RepID=A0A6A4IAR1_9AGAR|nr:hypothetical protein BT96DRAFT_811716 [Gymnopus androsaceus JB14]